METNPKQEEANNLKNATASKNKSSVSETGHAKNVANFEQLIAFCIGYGTAYNPTKNSLQIAELQTLHQTALTKLNNVKTQKTIFDNATNDRRMTFAGLKPLSTKIVNAFAVSGVDKLALQDAKGVNKKIQGATNKKTDEAAKNENENQTTKTISTSQQSYDRLIDHFANLIQVLEQNPVYNPNEPDLKLNKLQSDLVNMQAKNTNLINTYTQYSNTLIDRNQTLYNPLSGLVQIALEVKQYVKSVFGASSPQYKQISGLELKVIKAE